MSVTGTCAAFVWELIGQSTAIRLVASATTMEKAIVDGSRVTFFEVAIEIAHPCCAAGTEGRIFGCFAFRD